VQVQPISNTPLQQTMIKPDAWRLGDSIQEATQLIATLDGKLLLLTNSSKNDLTSQAVTCPINQAD
jgi:hypothetical protein